MSYTEKQIAENAISAFETAENAGYITRYSSENEVLDNSYEILKWMPEIDVDDLSDDEYDLAESYLVNELN